MASCELLCARVAIVNRKEEPASNNTGNRTHPALGDDWDFDAFAGFRVDAVPVKEFQFFAGW